MVRRLLIFILLFLPCVLCLTSCDLFVAVFSLSPFPAYLSQAVASVDMREEVEKFLGDEYDHWWSDVFFVADASGAQGVFLIVRKDSGGQWIYAFDTSLELISKDYMDYYSDLHLVDKSGIFVVGNIGFDPITLASYGWIDTNAGGRFAFSNGTYNMELESYFNTDPTEQSVLTVRYGDWPLPWPPDTPLPAETTIRSGEKFWLRGLGYDASLGLVYLFLFNEDSRYLQVVETNSTEYPASLKSEILDPVNYISSPPIYDVEDRYFCYTRKGFVGSARRRGFYQLLNIEGEVLKRFYIGTDDDRGFDFDIDGEYYYVFNRSNFRLYKANTGF